MEEKKVLRYSEIMDIINRIYDDGIEIVVPVGCLGHDIAQIRGRKAFDYLQLWISQFIELKEKKEQFEQDLNKMKYGV